MHRFLILSKKLLKVKVLQSAALEKIRTKKPIEVLEIQVLANTYYWFFVRTNFMNQASDA